MGILDQLTGQALDVAAEPLRTRRQTRESFRRDLVAQLRAYSVHIEQARISFHRLRLAIVSGSLTSDDFPPATVMEQAITQYDASQSSVGKNQRALRALNQDSPALEQAAEELSGLLYRRLNPRMFGVKEGSKTEIGGAVQDVSEKTSELDDAWARVRPLLDDALELEAVIFLRRFRHDVRYLISGAEFMTRRLLEPGKDGPKETQFSLLAIDEVLAAADEWNDKIGSVRRGFDKEKRKA